MARKGKLLGAVLVCALALPALAGPGAQAGGKPKYIDLDKVPKPKITGAQILQGLEEFVAQFPMRQTQSPLNILASEFLAAEAEEYGFESQILQLSTAGLPGPFRAVEAVKKGTTKPNEWIVFIAHYDIVPQTIEGAYDDGSGTNMMRFFARAFSKVKTNRSIALLWFDAEEAGLLASQAYAEHLKAQGQKVHAALGFDMVGIGYPAPYCICIYHGQDEKEWPLAQGVARYVNFDYLGFPEGTGLTQTPHVCVCGPNVRNSDERNFEEQGYFTMRWAGMRVAADYPAYHRYNDTIATMEEVAGSRKKLEAGTLNTFLSAYYTAIVLDNL